MPNNASIRDQDVDRLAVARKQSIFEKLNLPPEIVQLLEATLERLRGSLGENLHSCLLYGSAARGEFVSGASDINLLLVLKESTPEAHRSIGEALQGSPRIDPFVLALRGLERSMRVFAMKFLSIRRNYHLLLGVDPLVSLDFEPSLLAFLAEQELRNHRLREKRSYILYGGDRKTYSNYLVASCGRLFSILSNSLRCAGVEVPRAYADRLPLFERTWQVDTGVLDELLQLRRDPRKLNSAEAFRFHSGIFSILDRVAHWMEDRWPTTCP